MAFSLFPKEIKFFELFSEQNRKISEAVVLLNEIFSDGTDFSEKCAEIDEIEKEGNFIYRAISRKLSLTFITSIDRGDIYNLNVAQEDVLNSVRAISSRIGLYELSEISDEARSLISNLRSLTEETGKMLNCMKMKEDGNEEIRTALQIKSESDQLIMTALEQLYTQKNPNPEQILAMMQWTQLYDRIEEAIGRLERLVHVIEGIMLKYA
ncbi:MAG: DUF47 family protein [Syntrophaceae bacterium]|nr:DUF47 family protein [Syntrophaceae bacterium]